VVQSALGCLRVEGVLGKVAKTAGIGAKVWESEWGLAREHLENKEKVEWVLERSRCRVLRIGFHAFFQFVFPSPNIFD